MVRLHSWIASLCSLLKIRTGAKSTESPTGESIAYVRVSSEEAGWDWGIPAPVYIKCVGNNC
jgi:hypothetical protein